MKVPCLVGTASEKMCMVRQPLELSRVRLRKIHRKKVETPPV